MKNKGEIFYYLAVTLIFISTLSGWSTLIDLGNVYYILMTIAFFLLIISFFSYHHSFREYLFIIALFVIFIYTSLKLNELLFITNFMLIITLKKVNFRNIIKCDMAVKIIMLVIHFLFYLFNYLFSFGFLDKTYTTNGIGLRKSLFFNGPNALSGLLFWLVIDYLILNKDNKIIRKSIICLIPIFICYIFTKSRTSFYLYIIYLIMLFMSLNKIGKIAMKISQFILSDILFLFSFVLLKYSSIIISRFNALFMLANKLLSSRLSYSITAYNYYGLSLFANSKTNNIQDYFIVDNFYVKTIISFGVIVYLSLSILNKVVSKKSDNFYNIIISIGFIYLFCESFVFNAGLCIFILIFGYLFYKSNDISNNEVKDNG